MPINNFRPDKNNPRLDWDEMFMNIALISGQRAACIYHKVGSVFVDKYNRIVSIGYNGPSRGDYHCNEVGCAKIHGNPLTGKLEPCRGVHSEKNAIINCGNTDRLRDSTLYVTVFPCYRCMRELNNLGINRIVYLKTFQKVIPGSKDKVEEENEAWDLANRRGIALEQFDPEKRIVDKFSQAIKGSIVINKVTDTKKKNNKK